jgi:predicted RNA-binding protein associated with RNAse of E/G family
MPSEPWVLADDVWRDKSVLHLVEPGAAHAVWVMWDRAAEFLGWYVNLQEPLRRSPVGFDYMDQMLDLVISADLSEWHWKDEDELEQEVVEGLLTLAEADEVKAEGDRVVRMLANRARPFSEGWERWRPDPAWPLPVLIEGWDA